MIDEVGAYVSIVKVTMSAPHTAVAKYAPFTVNAYMTDSDFNPISSFDTVFTPDKIGLKLTATNPGTYYYNMKLTNNGPAITSPTITISVPGDFVLKPLATGQPVKINGAPATYVFTPGTPGILTVNAGNLGQGQTLTLTVHLDYALKGTTGWPADSQLKFVRPYGFPTKINALNVGGPTIAAVGKKVTAIGGFLTDTNGIPKGGLEVKVKSGSVQIGNDSSEVDGFYFIEVPAGSGYTIEVYNSMGNKIATKNSVTVAKDQFVSVDFNKLSPADPVIEGFVTDSSGNGIAGVTVQLIDVSGRTVATKTTNSGGYYVFRFTTPGTFKVQIIVPEGYSTETTSKTVKLAQFGAETVSFTLNKS